MLERIRHALERGIEDTGLRDDAAVVVVPGGGSLVVSVDSVVAGVHVDLALCSPADVGWKALMSAVSDLAAMGARPVGALVALCVPEQAEDGNLTLGVMEGVAEAARASGCPVVGGDVSVSEVLTVVVTVMGTVDGGVAVLRRGAQPGDVVLVTGPCGGSAAGLRTLRAHSQAEVPEQAQFDVLAAAYRRPVARLAEGVLAREAGAHAMIDISDGLALDLHRVADASSVGFALDGVPMAEGATLEEALGGGEDYELIVVIGPAEVETFMDRCAAAGLRSPRPIGVVLADPEDRSLGGEQLSRLGWQHPIG
jgi:thiamine-monophosphate kinase